MVARLIHRHAVAARPFPGACARKLADVRRGDFVVFGADAEAAMAVRDAANAHASVADPAHRLVDLGDLRQAGERLPAVLHALDEHGARPVMLGGNPDLGTAFVEALAGSPAPLPKGIILLSPRLDIRLPQDGASQALAIGTQRLIGQPSHGAWRASGGTAVPASVCEEHGADAALAELAAKVQAALLLVDLAVIDTGYAAGASFRNVGGLGPMAVLAILDRILAGFDVRALALFNLAPERDPRGHSERIAAMIAERVAAQGHPRRGA